MEAPNKPSRANDYAVAKVMNAEVFTTFAVVSFGDYVEISEYHEIPDFNRAYILLVSELERIYERNPELQAIHPRPLWKRFDMLKNRSADIGEYMIDGDDSIVEHDVRIERLCTIAGIEDPVFTPEQQKLMNDLDTHRKQYVKVVKEKWENTKNKKQISEYRLTYEPIGTILINGVFKLKKAHAGSNTERLLEQALKSPNTLFKPDIGQTPRNLSTVLSSAGFTKELRELFFPTVSNSKGIVFRPTISRKQADGENIDTAELDVKSYALGAVTEPKST
ncbi:hypothetical protein KBC77_02475 [Candidatus Saccharibacteria bacterium]|nr:hypothetical protein [Candidatus Saccharibacteria bacterium]